MSFEGMALAASAAGVAIVHTALGPDHYLPFAALSLARRWSAARTLLVTAACGLAHVAASLGLAAVAGGFGWTFSELAGLDAARGTLAAWLLLGFGSLYAWRALARGSRERRHAHPHAAAMTGAVTGWALFLIFLFGPCEPLVPLLLASASAAGRPATLAVASAFTLATLGAMLAIVFALRQGASRLALPRWRRHGHAAAGASIAFCGFAMLTVGL